MHRLYRVRWEQRLLVAICSIGAAAIFAMLVSGFDELRQRGIVSQLVVYAMPVLFVVFAIRSARIGIVDNDEGFEIRGVVRTSRVARRDVERFSLERGQGVLHTKAGQTVRLWHVQQPNPAFFKTSSSAQQMIEDLNASLATHLPVPSHSVLRTETVAAPSVPRRSVVVLLVQTMLGVGIGVTLLSSGAHLEGWVMIAASLIGSPAALLALRRVLSRNAAR